METLLRIVAFLSPVWLFGTYVVIGIRYRSKRAVWRQPAMLALPIAALIVVIGRFIMHERSMQEMDRSDYFYLGQDVWTAIVAYVAAWLLFSYIRWTARRAGQTSAS